MLYVDNHICEGYTSKSMKFYEVAPTGIIRPSSDRFTYHSLAPLTVGMLVMIPVGKKIVAGIILEETTKPLYATRPIETILEDTPLPVPLINLALWMTQYYRTHLGLVLQTILPRGLNKKRRERSIIPRGHLRDRTNFLLNSNQKEAVERISQAEGSVLLHGITGSGKTAVYIESALRTIASGRSVIVLVPEIALTSQVIAEFAQHFDNLLVTHSHQTEAERHLVWKQALTSDQPTVVIGPRSALFTPFTKVGLIIIDEAHEPSFKQEQSPRYSALRAAKILANAHHATLVMGSATPSISDFYMAQHTDTPILTLPDRARPNTSEPVITLVDMTKRAEFKHHRFLSKTLIEHMRATLGQGKQVLLFHNRRGTAATTLCTECGWIATDPDTDLPLTLHADRHVLQSHVTGKTWPVPTSCPNCKSVDIIHKGIGTKLVESEVRRLFPEASIARFDADTSKDDTVDKRYKELYDGSIDIIIGTQVIAKGLDLPHLRTVGIIQADSGLSLPDFGSSERVFQLLAQVIGRVGRSEHHTTVVVQSYQPHHPAVTFGLSQDYQGFYDHEIAVRKKTNFPPFCFLLKLTCVYKTEAAAIKNARAVMSDLRPHLLPGMVLFGPAPAFYERAHDTYRWQIIIKSSRRQDLTDILSRLPQSAHWHVELDPTSLL